ncbi:NAD-dependent epimerase/dehydratase family protein [Streptomyces albidoflavus]
MTSSTPKPLRVVVTGATGNVGTSVMRRLAEEPRVVSALGLARRTPRLSYPGVEWAACDLTAPEAPDRLQRLFEGADAVVHLAWRFQPTRDAAVTWEANVLGSLRVFEAAATVGVPALVHASSVGAYAPGPADGHRVDESWPTHGWPGAAYTREKAYLERVLDTFERDHPDTRVVRMRPAFLFKESAAGEQLRIFGHRLLPGRLLRPDLLPVLPGVRGLRFQALHTDDAADAYARAVVQEVRGPFNLAADPVIDGQVLAGLLESRSVELPPALPRAALSAGWRLRALGASPGLFDAVLRLPLLDTARARAELGWSPEHSATEALDAFLRGVRSHGGLPTAPLAGHEPAAA